MNLEKNMRNIFGHAIFAAAVNKILPLFFHLYGEWLGHMVGL